jgi:hypothetical protein
MTPEPCQKPDGTARLSARIVEHCVYPATSDVLYRFGFETHIPQQVQSRSSGVEYPSKLQRHKEFVHSTTSFGPNPAKIVPARLHGYV